MLISRYVDVGNSLTAAINGFLATKSPAAKAERKYAVTLDDLGTAGYVAEGINFRVFLMHDVPKWEQLTRAKDQMDWPFVLLLYEKCQENSSIPSNSWVDTRVKLADAIMREFGDVRKTLAGEGYVLRVLSSEYTIFVDQASLRENQEFWTEIEITYRELAGV